MYTKDTDRGKEVYKMLDEKKLLEEKELLEEEVAELEKKSYTLRVQADDAIEECRRAERKLLDIKSKLRDIKKAKEENDKEAHLRLFKEEFCLWINGQPHEYHHKIYSTDCLICPRLDIFQWENGKPWEMPKGTKEEVFELMREHGVVMVVMNTKVDAGNCWVGHEEKFFTSWDEIFK